MRCKIECYYREVGGEEEEEEERKKKSVPNRSNINSVLAESASRFCQSQEKPETRFRLLLLFAHPQVQQDRLPPGARRR